MIGINVLIMSVSVVIKNLKMGVVIVIFDVV